MPKSLPDRCLPDSIQEFRFASRQRFLDGHALASDGRRTAAIYLWGYAVEMLLKAAYFRLIGYSEDRQIKLADLATVAAGAATVGVFWPKPYRYHNLRLWGEILVNTRARNSTWNYVTPQFGSQVLSRSQHMQRLWRETLRYHKNIAYPYEISRVQQNTEWFITHSAQL